MADDPVVSLMGVAQLASRLRTDPEQVRLVDSRPFLDFNTCHIRGAVNVCCSKIVKRRLQHDKASLSVKQLVLPSRSTAVCLSAQWSPHVFSLSRQSVAWTPCGGICVGSACRLL